jgi:excisionase family DNA binding protein
MTAETPLLLTAKDAAKTLAVSEKTLYTLTRENRVKIVRIGLRCVRYDLRDLEAFILSCKGAQ